MSYKSTLNGVKLTKCDSQSWSKSAAASLEANVKFAGEEAKDRLYEPKHKKKLVRVLTVVAYVFFVSLAAIMLSLYYVFLWNGDQKSSGRHAVHQNQLQSRCTLLTELQNSNTAIEQLKMSLPATTTTEETTSTIWSDEGELSEDPTPDNYFPKGSTFYKKLLDLNFTYDEND